jgi:hypothetical protein
MVVIGKEYVLLHYTPYWCEARISDLADACKTTKKLGIAA